MFASVMVGGRGACKVLVVGVFKGEGLDKAGREHDADGAIAAALHRGEATGEAGALVEAFPSKGAFERVIVAGLGEKKGFEVGRLRLIGSSVAKRLSAIKETACMVDFAGAMRAARVKAREAGSSFAEGVGLASWMSEEFRGSATTKKEVLPLRLRSEDKDFEGGMEVGLLSAAGANEARTVSNTPPNICTPAWIADRAKKLGRDLGMKVRVFEGAELEKERFAGLINVGKASENAPCMVRMEYRPAKASKDARPLVLIGKTMTYDSGGLSLKVNNGMKGMKRDKDGGCAVLGAMRVIATAIKPDRPVVALLACAENAVSDEAYRPDDILTFRNGVTVEVTNTDAEGRLVLADALCWACEKENPAAIIDIATLTGGVVVALGKVYAGMWCDDNALRGAIEKAATTTGERVWRLPHHDEYREMMKSPIADILNSNPNREAHPIQGAAFLSYFVTPGVPWAHLDIAGVHEVAAPAGPFAVAGPTGFGARLLAAVAGGLAN
ncbi:MAG: leucyl aminopeptidase family protein [Phycisphaeraceae bacterium]|nr:leucyl aminopeptidase family protein [Phycisphaeraceae bacterium]